jgi:hypothetical protein
MAPSGKKVMQFLSEGRYVANVVDGFLRSSSWDSLQPFLWTNRLSKNRGICRNPLRGVHGKLPTFGIALVW